ncbi:MAG: phosphoglycolate phosphatase [Chloroflexota bacterium]
MTEPRRCDQLDDGGTGLVAPSERAGACTKRIHREAVPNNKELRVIPVNRARLVVDDRGESYRPSASRRFDAELHAAESIGITLRTSAERAVVYEGRTGFREGKDRRGLAAASPGGANTKAAREVADATLRLAGSTWNRGVGTFVHPAILGATYATPMKAVLFDWDGTLIDTTEHVYEANVEVMRSFGLPPLTRERYGAAFSPNWRRMYAALGVPEHLVEGAATVWHGAYKGHEAELLPGAYPALERLVAAGIPLGIVTAGDRKVVAGQLRRTGVADLIGSAVYGDDSVEQKPDPAPLRRGLAALGHATTPAETAYLGDTLDDVRMARAAGVRAVGIHSPFFHPDEFYEADAHEHAPSVAAWVSALLDGPKR